jgi:hypoxanthine phosphoribosyltransferase
LIVDDICDTGESLNTLLYDMKVVAPITRVETAVLAVKQNQPYRPNYYWMSIYPKDTDAWVDFFWEK